MTPRFEIFPGNDGKWYFRLRAGNGKIVCQSQGYGRKQHCKDGIWALCDAASGAMIDQLANGQGPIEISK